MAWRGFLRQGAHVWKNSLISNPRPAGHAVQYSPCRSSDTVVAGVGTWRAEVVDGRLNTPHIPDGTNDRPPIWRDSGRETSALVLSRHGISRLTEP